MRTDRAGARPALGEPAASARHVYFPITGFISLIAVVPGSPGLEVGMIGREGMHGAQLALGIATTPLQAVVQGAGSVLRIGRVAFRGELARSATLRRTLDRYIAVLMVQLATSAACVRFHQIGPRLARWLLMSHDRAHADSFEMTQEFLAHMLGVRRVGITAAAGALQRRGLIEYRACSRCSTAPASSARPAPATPPIGWPTPGNSTDRRSSCAPCALAHRRTSATR